MKSIKDLEEMKNQKCIPFGSQYNFFFMTLEDYYVGKLDGLARIKAELSNWNMEAQIVIVNELISIISASGIAGFDEEDLWKLTK